MKSAEATEKLKIKFYELENNAKGILSTVEFVLPYCCYTPGKVLNWLTNPLHIAQ